MALRISFLPTVAAVLCGLVAAGCLQSPSPTASAVFVGRLADDVNFQPFINTGAADVVPDATTCYPPTSQYCPAGGATLLVTVPGPGNVTNQYAGGAFVAGIPRNLSGYQAVTFWAKATTPAPLVVGLGNNNTGASLYPAEWNTTLTPIWTRYTFPIPEPAKLTAEGGLLYFAAGAVGSPGVGYSFWLSDIEYVDLGNALGPPTPVMSPACVNASVGEAAFAAFEGTVTDKVPVGFTVNETTLFTNASRRYYTFSSSDPTVATVDVAGMVSIQGAGSATVTAKLGGVDAVGPLTVLVNSPASCPPLAAPTTLAPVPTLPAAKVISLYTSSGTYTSVPITSWHTTWSYCCSDPAPPLNPDPNTPIIASSGQQAIVKKYTLRAFAGVGFGPDGSTLNEIDASHMTFLHLDLWTPNAFAFQVQLVNDPTQYTSKSTVQIDVGSSPPLATGQWLSLEIPMTAFNNLGGTSKLGQMLFLVPGGTSADVYLDNIYFHN